MAAVDTFFFCPSRWWHCWELIHWAELARKTVVIMVPGWLASCRSLTTSSTRRCLTKNWHGCLRWGSDFSISHTQLVEKVPLTISAKIWPIWRTIEWMVVGRSGWNNGNLGFHEWKAPIACNFADNQYQKFWWHSIKLTLMASSKTWGCFKVNH